MPREAVWGEWGSPPTLTDLRCLLLALRCAHVDLSAR